MFKQIEHAKVLQRKRQQKYSKIMAKEKRQKKMDAYEIEVCAFWTI